jgi:hypothetical protein
MSGRQDTYLVGTLGRRVTIAASIIVVAGVSWFGLKQYRSHILCNQRNALFQRQVKSIEQDAHERLRIGTKSDEVSRFFAEHGIPFEIVESQAFGTLYTSGCAPLGCGTDKALIGVRVKLDSAGAVAEDAKVVAMYTDCV